jgi:hypothetical protein
MMLVLSVNFRPPLPVKLNVIDDEAEPLERRIIELLPMSSSSGIE